MRKTTVKVEEPPEPNIYGILGDDSSVERFSSGSTLLDCVLGGGWCFERTANIVGDTSTFKTGLVIEAMANFGMAEPKGRIVYVEAESKFDVDYAQAIGFPTDRVELPNSDPVIKQQIKTVEALFAFLKKLTGPPRKGTKPKPKERTLVIVDSLDGMQSSSEEDDDAGKGYRLAKPKIISEIFEKFSDKLTEGRVTLMIVNQVRDNIGVMFGDKYRRQGGKSLDFYATHALWLAKIGQIAKTQNGVKRTVGTWIKANAKKNHAGPPHRQCNFPIFFYYGIEDVQANLAWLMEIKRTKEIDLSVEATKKLIKSLPELSDAEYGVLQDKLPPLVRKIWREIEIGFLPKRRKYG